MNLNQRLTEPALDDYQMKSKLMKKQTDNGFYNLGIDPKLLKGIDRLNFNIPTPIQREAIPSAINGDDIIALAKTGSGKTIAFGIPMLQRLSKSKEGTGLVLVPTRELAIQVEESLQLLSSTINLRSTVLIGGASMIQQLNKLKKNPRIIIATPGRLMDHIQRRTVKLNNVEVFILDEADRMLDMGFIPDIKKIIKAIPENRQTMLFSATMPKEIEAIANKLMTNPTRVETDRSGTTPSEVSHEMYFIRNQEKSSFLAVRLKECSGPVLVFTKTKRMARKLNIKVNSMGFTAAEIHSDRSLAQRRSALDGFKQGRYQILIATDIAARGIDVSGIEMVINYDMPANSEDYVHRIGRTGRAGKTGLAVSFVTGEQKRSVKSIERFMKTKMKISELPTLPTERMLLNDAEQIKSERKVSETFKPRKERSSKVDFNYKKRPFKKMAKTSGFKSRPVKSKPSSPFEIEQSESKSDNPFWMKLKKNKTSKKKSSGKAKKKKSSKRK